LIPTRPRRARKALAKGVRMKKSAAAEAEALVPFEPGSYFVNFAEMNVVSGMVVLLLLNHEDCVPTGID